MSSSIAIPRRKQKMMSVAASGTSSSSSSGEERGWTFGSYGSVKAEEEEDGAKSPPSSRNGAARRTSLMSASLTKTEHIVINVGNSESPRLITCVKTSQGFDWNQEIFLPSYASYDFDHLERKRDPVEDIVVTDEEVANMFPSDD
ncbi:hypothetical protein P280DRAFT_490353 [Massarina eburnea CBS 473.64]|uniref:Uncharacterized protein n=1 Tax=Massarina eburnea CBS 473.64 TaxID=1395130 RepID=A0A6A6RWI7_9PLEO|nr:hypothetical protein P280DRAFT_490353 [Massarina eburnea CBS 473.64]